MIEFYFTVFFLIQSKRLHLKVEPADCQYLVPVLTLLISKFEQLDAKTFHKKQGVSVFSSDAVFLAEWTHIRVWTINLVPLSPSRMPVS